MIEGIGYFFGDRILSGILMFIDLEGERVWIKNFYQFMVSGWWFGWIFKI